MSWQFCFLSVFRICLSTTGVSYHITVSTESSLWELSVSYGHNNATCWRISPSQWHTNKNIDFSLLSCGSSWAGYASGCSSWSGSVPFVSHLSTRPSRLARHVILMAKAEVQERKLKHPKSLKPSLRVAHSHFYPHANDQNKLRGLSQNQELEKHTQLTMRTWKGCGCRVQGAMGPMHQSTTCPDFYHANLTVSISVSLRQSLNSWSDPSPSVFLYYQSCATLAILNYIYFSQFAWAFWSSRLCTASFLPGVLQPLPSPNLVPHFMCYLTN
jgi:hypothetical protein